MIDDKP